MLTKLIRCAYCRAYWRLYYISSNQWFLEHSLENTDLVYSPHLTNKEREALWSLFRYGW